MVKRGQGDKMGAPLGKQRGALAMTSRTEHPSLANRVGFSLATAVFNSWVEGASLALPMLTRQRGGDGQVNAGLSC